VVADGCRVTGRQLQFNIDLRGPSLRTRKPQSMDWFIGEIAVTPCYIASTRLGNRYIGWSWVEMTAAPEMRVLAHRLLAYEANADNGSEPTGWPMLRVYEKLRHSLVEFVGISGFQSLAMRALTMTRPEAAGLGGLRIAQNGSLEGLGEIDSQSDMEPAADVGILLIVRLLELLRMFIGEALTLSLLRNAWPGEVFDDGNAVNGRKA